MTESETHDMAIAASTLLGLVDLDFLRRFERDATTVAAFSNESDSLVFVNGRLASLRALGPHFIKVYINCVRTLPKEKLPGSGTRMKCGDNFVLVFMFFHRLKQTVSMRMSKAIENRWDLVVPDVVSELDLKLAYPWFWETRSYFSWCLIDFEHANLVTGSNSVSDWFVEFIDFIRAPVFDYDLERLVLFNNWLLRLFSYINLLPVNRLPLLDRTK
jgi:hypothetical protein